MTVLDWLLDSDAAIRWQVLRDLVHAPAEDVAAERARVATEGWGARLLALQGEDGQGAGGACFPAEGWRRAENQGQPWSSTLPTLPLLHDFGGDPLSDWVRRGEEYLLERKLVRRKSTGEVVNSAWLQFSFPPRWHYDVLRALEYFRSVGDVPDSRMVAAIDLLRSKQQPDGTWLLENTHPGKVHFALEDGDGRPSRWNTLRALRVLSWCEQSAT